MATKQETDTKNEDPRDAIIRELEAKIQEQGKTFQAFVAKANEREEAARKSLEEGPEAPIGDDRARVNVTVSLLEKHAHWLEVAAAVERARRGITDKSKWTAGNQLEKLVRAAVTIDPSCGGAIQVGYGGSGPRGSFNLVTGSWG